MQELPVKVGDTIVEEGDAGEHYYVIRRGRCSVSRRPDDGAPALRLAELRPGDAFGEESLISGCEQRQCHHDDRRCAHETRADRLRGADEQPDPQPGEPRGGGGLGQDRRLVD